MATKKNTTSRKNDKPSEPRKRTEILRADLVRHALERHDLPADGTVEEQAERLEAFFRSTYEKNLAAAQEALNQARKTGSAADRTKAEENFKAVDIIRCHPMSCVADASARDDLGMDCSPSPEPGSLGCHFKSLPEYAYCPFCGLAEDDAGRDALAKVEKTLAPIAAEAALAPKPGEVIATSAAEIKAKRERKKKEPKPPNKPSASMIPSSTVAGLDGPTAEADKGFTVAYLDVLERRVIDARSKRHLTEVETFFAEGEALKEIRDKNLFALILNADGKPVFPNFGSYAMATFDYSHSHASKLVRIVEWVPKEIALSAGVAKASLLAADGMSDEIRARLLPIAASLTVRELEAKIKTLTEPEPPAVSAVGGAPTAASFDEDGVYHEDDEADDSEDDEADDDGENPPRSKRGEAEESDAELLRPKTVAVTLSDEEHVIELMVAGSSVKPAKKISDGPHAEISTISGHKLRFDLRVGEGGTLEVVMKIRRPG